MRTSDSEMIVSPLASWCNLSWKINFWKKVIHTVMCVNLKQTVNHWGISVVGALTLSCPAVSQIRNLCSSFPDGTVLVRNDALWMIRRISQQCFYPCSLKRHRKQISTSQQETNKMFVTEAMLPGSTEARKATIKKETANTMLGVITVGSNICLDMT